MNTTIRSRVFNLVIAINLIAYSGTTLLTNTIWAFIAIATTLVFILASRANPADKTGWLLPISVCLVCWLSVSLSYLVSDSTTSSFYMTGITLSALFLSSYVNSFSALVPGIVIAGIAVLCLSLYWAARYPELGLSQGYWQSGALQGIFPHKNSFGLFMLIAYSGQMQRVWSTASRKIPNAFLSVIFASAVFASRSANCIIILVLVTVLAVIGLIRFKSKNLVIALLAISAMLILYQGSAFSPIFQSLGRDESLTGRTEIWNATFDVFSKSPILGWGWGGVWNDASPIAELIRASVGFPVTEAHNAILDSMVQIGLVGSSLILVTLGVAFIKAKGGERFGWTFGSRWMLGVIFVHSITEATLDRPLGWFIVCSISGLLLRGNSGNLNLETGEEFNSSTLVPS